MSVFFITTKVGTVHGGPNVHHCAAAQHEPRKRVTDKQIDVYALPACAACWAENSFLRAVGAARRKPVGGRQ